MSFKTADLCDQYPGAIEVAEPIFADFGGRIAFSGPAVTIETFEDNSLIRETLQQPGGGRVLAVDGAGSLRCALVGDRLGAAAVEHGWAGLVIHGCVRDTAELAELEIGIKAIAAHPRRSVKRGIGERDRPLRFAGVTICPGHYVYADEDGLIVAPRPLTQPP